MPNPVIWFILNGKKGLKMIENVPRPYTRAQAWRGGGRGQWRLSLSLSFVNC